MNVFNSTTVIIEGKLPPNVNLYANDGLIDITREHSKAQKSAYEDPDSSSSETNFADMVPLSNRYTTNARQLCTESSDVMEIENVQLRNQIF
eukprot:3701392-Ditylum_brightwellii.AAC.1